MEIKRLIKKLVLGFFIVLVSFILFGLIYNVYELKNSSRFYEQGVEFIKHEDYSNAYYNFSKISFLSSMYPTAVFMQAKAADKLQDFKTAQEKYFIFDKIFKNEYVSPYILWRLGQIYYSNGKNHKAKKTFLRLKKDYPDSEYGIAANYMLTKLSFPIEKKKEFYLEYMKNSPNGKYIHDVLLSAVSDEKIKFTNFEKIVFAQTLYLNDANNRAITVLKELPVQESWVYLVKCLDKLNSSSNVVLVAETGLGLDNSIHDEEILSEALKIYVKHKSGDKIKIWDDIYNKTNDEKIKAIALYNSAKLSTPELKRSKEIKLVENYPQSKFSGEVLFTLFMNAVKNNKPRLALKYSKIYLTHYDEKNLTPCILYFTILIKNKNMDLTYKSDLSRLLSDYPHSYYTYRAYSTFVNKKFYAKRTLPIEKASQNIEFPIENNKNLETFIEAVIDVNGFDILSDFRIKDPVLLSWIEYKKGNRALSSVIARDYLKNTDTSKLKNSKTARKLAYPVYYADEINHYAKIRNLNPYLFLALVKEESHFDPNIRSYVGATGLTQIMPSTAKMVSGKDYTIENLLEPKLNIDLGTRYFAYLMKVFSNDESLCVLSYNSGPNAVKKWLNEDVSFDLTVENIPYQETKEYIKKVYSSYWNYLLTYGGVKL